MQSFLASKSSITTPLTSLIFAIRSTSIAFLLLRKTRKQLWVQLRNILMDQSIRKFRGIRKFWDFIEIYLRAFGKFQKILGVIEK